MKPDPVFWKNASPAFLIITLLILLVMLSGCAVSTQRFVDVSYEEGLPVRSVVLTTRTIVPPFSSNAVTDKLVMMEETEEGWDLQIGTEANLEGGDATAITESIVEGIVRGLQPVGVP